MTENEFAQLKKRVAKSGMKQAVYLRKAALNKPIISTDGIREIVPELKRIGNNINQIAKKCNGGYMDVYDEVLEQGRELREVWQLLRQFLQGRH